jgi:hypothetical protein
MIEITEDMINELLFGGSEGNFVLWYEDINYFEENRRRIESEVIIKDCDTQKFYSVRCCYGTGGYGCINWIQDPVEVEWVPNSEGSWKAKT